MVACQQGARRSKPGQQAGAIIITSIMAGRSRVVIITGKFRTGECPRRVVVSRNIEAVWVVPMVLMVPMVVAGTLEGREQEGAQVRESRPDWSCCTACRVAGA
jgi:hypothetical protein